MSEDMKRIYEEQDAISRQLKAFEAAGPPELAVDRGPRASSVDLVGRVIATDPNRPGEICKALKMWIEQFESKLDPQSEVGARVVNFGETLKFYLRDVYNTFSPLVLFKGTTSDGQPVELIQHVSQISVLLIALPKQKPTEERRPIGFHTESTSPSESK